VKAYLLRITLEEKSMEMYLTVEDVAAVLKLSVQTIRRYVLKKEIPYHKIIKAVRFKPSEIEKWVERKNCANVPYKGEGENTIF
jgi:excisionase family DNA binding protein